MIIRGHNPRLRRTDRISEPANSNYSPSTGRVICRVLCSYDLRANPYPKVAKRGHEIERLMHLPNVDLSLLGLERDRVVHHVLQDILQDPTYCGANR